ncbi:MAG: hypothetical protein EP311_00800 [Cytophagales bacterium]|nr:MAG: hypothetical protein EP311_00800 [Cytophagales bacterium]
MKYALKIFPILLLCFILFSCQDNEEPENLLDQVGFEGTLPDGETSSFESNFEAENTPIVFNFRTDTDGNGTIYQGNVATHLMKIKEPTRGFEIYIRLPELKWSDQATSEFNSKFVFEEIYSFDKVKEVLEVGEKKINVIDFNYNKEDFGAVPDFIQVYYVPNGAERPFQSGLYNPFFHEGKYEIPTDNYLRVINQREGTFINDKGVQKRLLLVEFELKIQMYEIVNGKGYVFREPLEGKLRMAFREDIPDWAR